MKNKYKTGCSIVIFAMLIVGYGLIYPMVLQLFFYPNPAGVDMRQENNLKQVFLAASTYAQDNNGLMPSVPDNLKLYMSLDLPASTFELSCLSRLPAMDNACGLLVAYTSKPSPRAPTPREYLCFYKLRHWPTKPVPERRHVIFSSGVTTIIEETVFEKYLEQETERIKNSVFSDI